MIPNADMTRAARDHSLPLHTYTMPADGTRLYARAEVISRSGLDGQRYYQE